MKLFLAILFLCAGCVVRERVKVEYREAPPKVIERIYPIPAIPIVPDAPEEPKPKPPMTA